MSFSVGDRIAHPLHGAGIIDHIEKRRVNNVDRDYYVLRLSVSNIIVMIPCDSYAETGIRPAMSEREILASLSDVPVVSKDSNLNWNKRYRDNMAHIKSGNLTEVASVIKDMYAREQSRGLSSSERKMLNAAKDIILSELVLATGKPYELADDFLNSMLIQD